MKFKNILFFVSLLLFCSLNSFGQIEKVIVETYYISDSLDATDTTGGLLEAGSRTYRIYLDLIAGSKVQKIYGDANHLLKFSSTDLFFNNLADGQTFGKDFSKNRLYENTVALDTWLTLGQVTKASSKVFGVPKTSDDDGSFIGGANNDGGSAIIPGGLLTNADPAAGIPLTVSDGNDTMTVATGSWFDYGILSSNSDDSTIFGSLVAGTQFECNNCGLQYAGVSGVNPDSNYVLLAQLTTKGNIEFELNVEVSDTAGAVIKYVANDSILLADEVLNRYLKFPFEQICGCPDSNYVEYLADRDCNSLDSCKNIVVFGCMDTSACNFNPDANINVKSLCCYPGKCNDRDLAFVCPQLNYGRNDMSSGFDLFPNPAIDNIRIKFVNPLNNLHCFVYNSIGQMIAQQIIENTTTFFDLSLSGYTKGIYLIKIDDGAGISSKTFIKE